MIFCVWGDLICSGFADKNRLAKRERSIKKCSNKTPQATQNFPLDQTQSQISLKATETNNHKTTTC
jgi:hypothetical protein